MTLTKPTVAELAVFTNKSESALTSFAGEAINQAAFLVEVVGRIDTDPTDATLLRLVKYGIMDMAYQLINENPYAKVKSSPFSSESIGSYSYTKSGAAMKALNAEVTGLRWFDLLMDRLREALGVDSMSGGGVTVFEHDNIYLDQDGDKWVLTDAQVLLNDDAFFFNTETRR